MCTDFQLESQGKRQFGRPGLRWEYKHLVPELSAQCTVQETGI
jgi:hypothetical protein